jgi:hypothetical protein
MAAVQAPVEVFFECPSTELKRLGFVENAASNSMSYVTGSTAFAKACGYYSSAKDTSMLKVRAQRLSRGAARACEGSTRVLFRVLHERGLLFSSAWRQHRGGAEEGRPSLFHL